MIKANFTIPGDPNTFEGYHQGAKWNGWDCPSFTKEIALQIIKTYSTSENPLTLELDFIKLKHTTPSGDALYDTLDGWTWELTPPKF